jgi:signal transduction histidine kinase
MSGRARTALSRTRLRLPIRLKLAVVSAGLTFVILLLFALVIGAVTEQRIRGSFDDDLRATAADLQDRTRVQRNLDGSLNPVVPPDLFVGAAAGGNAIRVVQQDGQVISSPQANSPDLGRPFEGVRDIGVYRVASRPLFARSLDRSNSFDLDSDPITGAVAYVQYAKPRRNLQSTLNRLHLFLALGVLGGTGLAFLAGFAVAHRAMRPIAGLTRAAREVARTRDPAMTLPKPEANDEVAELADTLEDMLRQLDAARGETEAALERQREFVADASHELRTPLTSILANLELLEEELDRRDGPRDRQTAAEIAGSALRSSQRMRRLVGDLLLLARADAAAGRLARGEAAGTAAVRRTVDLAAIARDAAREAGPLSSGHPVSLDLPSDTDVARLEGSPDDLHRLTLNLIENALIHTPPGTPIVVSVRREDEDLVLEVADRGPGIAPDMRERIFERFARHGGDRGGGSGLGLAIVRAVAEAHGGTVSAGPAEGGGAVFSVRLPAPMALRSPGDGVCDPSARPDPDLRRAKSP